MAARVQFGQSHRVLCCFGATVGEEHHVQVAWCNLGDESCGLRTHVVGVERRDGAHLCCIVLNCLHQFGVLVSDIDVHQLAGEIEELLAVGVPKVRTLGFDDVDGVDQRLG